MRLNLRRWAQICAVAFPVAILTLLFLWIVYRPALTGRAYDISQTLERHDPEVLVLGSSLALRGINERTLGLALGVNPKRILVLGLPHATAVHDVTILRHRVFGEGHKPRLVIIADALRPLLTHELLTEPINLQHLAENLEDGDADLLLRVFGESNPMALRIAKWRAKARSIKSSILTGWRNLWVLAAFQPEGGVRGAVRLVDRANERLLAGVNPAVPDHDKAVGMGHLVGSPIMGDAYDLHRNGVLDLLADAVQDGGAKLVIARLPLPPSSAGIDDVSDTLEHAAREWLDALNVAYIDLRGVPLSQADFEDSRHLSPRGASTVSKVLGDAIMAMRDGNVPNIGIGKDAAAQLQRPELPVLVHTEGCRYEAPAGILAGLGRDKESIAPAVPWPVEVLAYGRPLARRTSKPEPCSGGWALIDQRVVVETAHLGDSAKLAWAASPQVATTGERILWLAPGAKAQWIRDTQTPVPLRGRARAVGQPQPLSVFDARDQAVQPPIDASATWFSLKTGKNIALSNAGDSGWWLVHQLVVGDPPFGAVLLGRAETLRSAGARLAGGLNYRAPVDIEIVGEVPKIEPTRRQVRGDVLGLLVPGYAALADSTDARIRKVSECSPLRVTYRGAVLQGEAHASCPQVGMSTTTATCHAGRVVWVNPGDTDRVTDPQQYGLTFDASRYCEVLGLGAATAIREAWWLYPGDVMTVHIPGARLERFRDGARSLLLEVLSLIGGHTDPVDVRLYADGRLLLDTVWEPAIGATGPRGAMLALPERLPPGARDLKLELVNRSASRFILFVSALLTESKGTPPITADAPAIFALRARRDGTPSPSVTLRAKPGKVPSSPLPPKIRPITAGGLRAYGLEDASPLAVFAKDTQLTRMPTVQSLTACTQCFVDYPRGLMWVGPPEVRASIDTHFGVPTTAKVGDGFAWWIHAGQTGRWWLKPADVSRTVSLAVHAFSAMWSTAGEGAVARVGGQVIPFGPLERDGTRRASIQIMPSEEPSVFSVMDTTGTSILLIDRLVLQDNEGSHPILPPQAK